MAAMMAEPASAETTPPTGALQTERRLAVVVDGSDDRLPERDERDEAEVRGFGMAIVLGILIGIPALAALVAALVLVAAPETEPIAIAGIALWVSLFCGPFLAGTVTVGLWSGRHH